MRNRKYTQVAIALSLGLWPVIVLAADRHHEGDVTIARTIDNQLTIEFDAAAPIVLPPVNALLQGWADSEPGFESIEEAEPDEGLFLLGDEAAIRLEIVSLTPGLKAWTPGFAHVLRNPLDTHDFPAGPEFHEHLTWHVDTLDALFNPLDTAWTAQFRLVDVGSTAYAASDVYSINFTPEPSAGLLAALGTLLISRRRG
jgi:hypothetical protein